jgi:GNAT superfamily N-acetyltransferase
MVSTRLVRRQFGGEERRNMFTAQQLNQTQYSITPADTLTVTFTDIANAADRAYLHRQIQTFNDRVSEPHRAIRESGMEPLDIFIRDNSGKIVGGLSADTFWGWMRIKDLWVDESLRNHHYGSQLVALAETKARVRGCLHVRLATFSFQARTFYEKVGYSVVGALEDYPSGQTFYWMRKDFG